MSISSAAAGGSYRFIEREGGMVFDFAVFEDGKKGTRGETAYTTTAIGTHVAQNRYEAYGIDSQKYLYLSDI